MPRTSRHAVALGLLLACCRPQPSAPPEAAAPEEPRAAVGAGDTVEIRVFDEERFDGTYEVEEDGTISFPFVGVIKIGGKTASEAGHEIEARLADGYLKDPHVSVLIKARSNREVSVLGQVNEPGSFPWQERLTLAQAVSLAGGMTPFAAPRRVKIRRKTASGETAVLDVSLDAIVNGRADDVELQPGDVVFVPESKI
ncbi:MAG: polysaccharide biosynthesis/export family protein [Nannocystaceae bacterium]|nr:polysaccharide export protein [Myxococcales bacterium]